MLFVIISIVISLITLYSFFGSLKRKEWLPTVFSALATLLFGWFGIMTLIDKLS
ncbi:DUF2759 domain-containing protein [Microaerobacter geothermalis]|uniref:DUF2759 family protein n=1 Tax=Microaerobacter geothermalis TaxID=674972 RepID=UPI001F17E8A4|nr:DUF2759 family protein [Microaerobacter geothermalis]MCF6093050.1 DUF2759 domain-containing protein [Microaerobacter geothermalis]